MADCIDHFLVIGELNLDESPLPHYVVENIIISQFLKE